jgi:hypothetical protein
MNGPDLRKNLQVNQPGIQGNEVNDDNGWPTPLTDPSNPLKMAVTSGSNGEQRNFDPVATAGQDQLSLSEGSSKIKTGDMEAQGGHSDKFKTSQQNADDHSTGESGD